MEEIVKSQKTYVRAFLLYANFVIFNIRCNTKLSDKNFFIPTKSLTVIILRVFYWITIQQEGVHQLLLNLSNKLWYICYEDQRL